MNIFEWFKTQRRNSVLKQARYWLSVIRKSDNDGEKSRALLNIRDVQNVTRDMRGSKVRRVDVRMFDGFEIKSYHDDPLRHAGLWVYKRLREVYS